VPAEDDYAKYSEIAAELELDEEEADDFITTAMTKRGYKPVKSWSDPEPEPEQKRAPARLLRAADTKNDGPRSREVGKSHYAS